MNSIEKEAIESKDRIAEIFTFLTRFCSVQTVSRKKNGGDTSSRAQSSSSPKRKNSSIDEGPVKLEDLLTKLKDEEYVKENLRPEEDSGIIENEEYVMFIEHSKSENKENQRLMMNFQMFDFALYFIKYRTDDAVAASP